MNKRYLIYLLALIVALTASCAGSGSSNNQDNPNSDIKAAIDQMLTQKWQAFKDAGEFYQGGMAVRLITPSGNYYSSVDLGNYPSDQLHFRGASTTKTFTAAAIMLMHQRGQLNIDDTVVSQIPGTANTYLPNSADYAVPNKSVITIRQLLSHRAGIFDVTNDSIPSTAIAPYAGKRYVDYVLETQGDAHTFTFDELVGVVSSHQLSYFVPGAAFHYSNTGYSMLGKIIERVSGQSYAEFIAANFVKPLGLKNTQFWDVGSKMDLPWPYAQGFTKIDTTVYDTTQANPSRSVAEGNVITTPRDLSLWVSLLLSGQAGLNATTLAMMMDIMATDEHHVWYGLGITYTQGLGYGHNGGTAGYMTVMRYDPVSQVSVVVFTSVLQVNDLYGQGDLLIEVAKQAKALSGY